MSSKSDRDNRSNQLNPNNGAYYSSRGASGEGRHEDDEDGYVAPRVDYGALARMLRGLGDFTPTAPADLWRFEKRFFFDFVDLDGGSRHFTFVGRAFHNLQQAEDVAEKWMARLILLYPRAVPLAMSRVIDPVTGKEYSWMSDRYKSGVNMWLYYKDLPEREAAIAMFDAKWERTGKVAVERVHAEWSACKRFDLGACTHDEMGLGNGGDARLTAFLRVLSAS